MTDLYAEEAIVSELKQIFRPATPTVDRHLFRGRTSELRQCVGAIQEVGMHAVIYGERGVGKSSLGNMARDAFVNMHPLNISVRIACNMDDDFGSIWRKLPNALRRELDDAPEGLRDDLQPIVDRVDDILELEEVTPDTVARAIHLLGRHAPTLIIIDEFDRIGDWESTKLFPDLIKAASDDPSAATVVLIGVADDVNGLVQGHASIDRAMRQIAMPRMTHAELAEVVTGGLATLTERTGYEIEMHEDVVDSITRLSQGFPYYTHLLAGTIIERAVRSGSEKIEPIDVFSALIQATDAAAQSIKASYAAATDSQQNATYRQTLLACALSRNDVMGYFRAADVAPPLAQIANAPKRQADFNHHLKRFSGAPIYILDVAGKGTKKYRFADPLMKPFVLMTGLRDGMLEGFGRDDEEDSNLP